MMFEGGQREEENLTKFNDVIEAKEGSMDAA